MLFFFALHFFFFLHFLCEKCIHGCFEILVLRQIHKGLSRNQYAMIFERLIDEMLYAKHQDFCLLANHTFMNV
jgi:hypothetical protein